MDDGDFSDKKVFISVVSHGHSSMLKELASLEKLAEKYTVIIKNNKADAELSAYCLKNNIHLLDSDLGKGFGYNNNVVFNYCKSHLNMKNDDFFLVVNPDIIIDILSIHNLVTSMSMGAVSAATINLYKDEAYTTSDDSVRNFPTISDFFKSFVFGVNRTKLDKRAIFHETPIDWCAGSFMAFTAHAFNEVKGFDVNYFMYCEDVDICYRLRRKNISLVYYPNIKAIHKARHNNRELLSRHFWWHLKSVLIFILAKNGFVKAKSNLMS